MVHHTLTVLSLLFNMPAAQNTKKNRKIMTADIISKIICYWVFIGYLDM
jgi:hypothetical protein